MSRSASDVPSNHSTPTVDRRNLLQGVAKGEAQCHVAAPEKDPAYDLDDAVLANFMKVPRALTGMPLASLQGLRLGHEYLVQRDLSECVARPRLQRLPGTDVSFCDAPGVPEAFFASQRLLPGRPSSRCPVNRLQIHSDHRGGASVRWPAPRHDHGPQVPNLA